MCLRFSVQFTFHPNCFIFSINTYTLKRKILTFTNKFSKRLSKPERKFTADITYGMLASGSCLLTDVADQLHEDLFACWCETHIPRKVPESENFYKILRSRTFVESRINTGFTASCFFGTLLIVFAKIKDFYEFTRRRQHTTSTVLSLSQQSSCISPSPKYTGKRNFMCFRNLPSGCSCS